MNMKEAKQVLMDLAAGKNHGIKYELFDHGNGSCSQKCHIYIQSHGWQEAAHWDEAIKAMQDQISGKPSISEDLPISKPE
ncbi:hypothetical protein ACQE3E_06505 [Methylomonas sp. MED-D]|uniref:hypothetical protein n=1 Tax=Methylomonas sp. MED-D TaxID=3418768 RepID=UPI003CFE5D88